MYSVTNLYFKNNWNNYKARSISSGNLCIYYQTHLFSKLPIRQECQTCLGRLGLESMSMKTLLGINSCQILVVCLWKVLWY